jgi:hypothetical protein
VLGTGSALLVWWVDKRIKGRKSSGPVQEH